MNNEQELIRCAQRGDGEAFRQLVEGAIAREVLEAQLLTLYPDLCSKPKADSALQSPPSDTAPCSAVYPAVYFVSNAKSRSNLFGHKSANRIYFAKNYPWLNIQYITDTQLGLQLPDNRYLVVGAGRTGSIESVKKITIKENIYESSSFCSR